MIVVLDDTLEVSESAVSAQKIEYAKERTVKALFNVAKKRGFNGKVNVSLEDEGVSGKAVLHTLGFVGMLSKAYSAHLPVVVAPHDFWFIANCELAAIVAKNPEQFRHVFAAHAEGKKTMLIPTGDVTRIDYYTLAGILDENIPDKRVKDLLVPGLTTVDENVFHALCATLADTCQHYYDYMTFCCGIPKIKVRGEESDYRLLAAASRELAGIFGFSTDAVTYYDRIAGLFDRMADTFIRGPEESAEFWRAIFTQKNVGSGGQVDIDGWIRDFFTKRPARLESFDTAIAAIPYKNLETQMEFLGLVGAFTAFQDSEGFWRMNFQEAVFTKVPKEDEEPEEIGYGMNYETGEKTIHYSNGTTKIVKFAKPSNKVPAISQKRAEEISNWTLQELPAVSMASPQARGQLRGMVRQGDTYETAIVHAMEAIMRAEDTPNLPPMTGGVIRGVGWVEDASGLLILEKKKEEKK